jgi:hypothetical protein
LEDQVGRQNDRIEGFERGIGLLGSAKAYLEGKIATMEWRRRNVEGRWPALVTLMQCAERKAEKDPRGYRLDEPMRAPVTVSQLVPKTLWKTHPVPWGMLSCKTWNSVFDAIVDRMGVRTDVFDGSSPNIEKILSIHFSQGVNSRIVVSVAALSVTPRTTVDFKNSMVRGGIIDIALSEEQRRELWDNPEVLQEFVAAWIVAINLVADVPGKRSLPVATLPATKAVADRRAVRWSEDILEHFGRCG